MKKLTFLLSFLLLSIISIGNLFYSKQEGDLLIIDSLLEQYQLSEKVDAADVLLVGEGKEFSQLQAAVNRAKDGDVIIVLSGIYEEAIDASNKTISIIGQSRNECILTYPNGDYYSPPIEMGSGLLANMTVYAQQQNLVKDAIAPAYAIHIDYDISRNTSFEIIDVTFINESYQTVGIGLRDHFTLHFQNCTFECKYDNNSFYCHDDPIGEKSVSQKLIVECCYFINYGTQKSTILMQSQEMPNSEILCEWRNNLVENRSNTRLFAVQFWNEPIDSDSGWQGMSFWRLSPCSSGNSLPQLNYTLFIEEILICKHLPLLSIRMDLLN